MFVRTLKLLLVTYAGICSAQLQTLEPLTIVVDDYSDTPVTVSGAGFLEPKYVVGLMYGSSLDLTTSLGVIFDTPNPWLDEIVCLEVIGSNYNFTYKANYKLPDEGEPVEMRVKSAHQFLTTADKKITTSLIYRGKCNQSSDQEIAITRSNDDKVDSNSPITVLINGMGRDVSFKMEEWDEYKQCEPLACIMHESANFKEIIQSGYSRAC